MGKQDAVLLVPKTIAQCRFAGCVFHRQDTVQGCCYQLLPVNSRLLAVSYAGKIPLCFRWQEFHLPNARAETVCSLSSDVSSRRSLHRHCGANRSSALLLVSYRAPGRNRTFVRRLTAARSAIEPPEHIEQRGKTRHPFFEGRTCTFRHPGYKSGALY